MTEFVILPAVAFGLLLGVLEIIFLSQEGGVHPLTHAAHAIPTMIFFTFIGFNITWALSLFKLHDNLTIDIIARVIIGIIAMIKIRAAASVTGRAMGRMGETWGHVFIIGLLMMAGPFVWEYVLIEPVQKVLPWIK